CDAAAGCRVQMTAGSEGVACTDAADRAGRCEAGLCVPVDADGDETDSGDAEQDQTTDFPDTDTDADPDADAGDTTDPDDGELAPASVSGSVMVRRDLAAVVPRVVVYDATPLFGGHLQPLRSVEATDFRVADG